MHNIHHTCTYTHEYACKNEYIDENTLVHAYTYEHECVYAYTDQYASHMYIYT
jgi:hypothetical protein